MLGTRKVIDAGVLLHHRCIFLAVQRGGQQRCNTAPVLIGRVDVVDLGHELFGDMGKHAAALAGQRIGQFHVGIREDVGRIEKVQERVCVPGCLTEAQVETAPRRAADLRYDPVIRLAALLVLVEAHVDECAQRASGL